MRISRWSQKRGLIDPKPLCIYELSYVAMLQQSKNALSRGYIRGAWYFACIPHTADDAKIQLPQIQPPPGTSALGGRGGLFRRCFVSRVRCARLRRGPSSQCSFCKNLDLFLDRPLRHVLERDRQLAPRSNLSHPCLYFQPPVVTRPPARPPTRREM